MLDLLIKNGLIVDGTGEAPYQSDLGIRDGRIVLPPGGDPPEAEQTLEADGLAVCPGFIDMHSHADLTLYDHPEAPSLVHQGVTTAVTGQCGDSPAPLFPKTKDEVIAAQAIGGNRIPGDKWTSWAEHLDYFRKTGVAVNLAPLVGQGNIRAGIMGFAAGPAPPPDLETMRLEVAKAMDDGAWGISTGLIYPPGSYAGTEELIALAEPVGERGGFYFSHIRGEGANLIPALREAVEIGRRTGAKVRISHLKASWPNNWPKMDQALGLIEQAREEGVSVMADVYPYTAGSTWLKSVLPQWAQEGERGEVLDRLADPEARQRIREEMGRGGLVEGDSWSRVMITRSPGYPGCAGKYVSALAQGEGLDPLDWIFEGLIKTGLAMTMVVFMISEENVQKALKHPLVAVGSDSSTVLARESVGEEYTHPRTFGTFPRVLSRYVREKGLLTLEEGVRKMTGLAAESLGLADRGLIKEGRWADLVVFDPQRIKDTAGYEDPFKYPEGIEAVFCNGIPTLYKGRQTDNRPGRVLERSRL